MSDAFEPGEAARRAHDRGKAVSAWRWFSDNTVRAAEHHRDTPWPRLARRAAIAAALVIGARLDPTLAISPWLLLIGLGWLLLTARAAGLKALDAATQR